MKTVPVWKVILAFIFDFFLSFLIFGFTIASLTRQRTSDGFNVEGLPALLVFILMICYFIIMNKFFGGTLGKKIFGVKKFKVVDVESESYK